MNAKSKNEQLETLKKRVRNIPDFPIPGIQFKDVTTLFNTGESLRMLTDILVSDYKDKGITKVVGIESRGFIMGPIMALELGAGFVPIRKPGKLPAEIFEEEYQKEYGTDKIQIHKDALSPDDTVLIHDDLLATGGTMFAAYNMIKKMGVKEIHVNFIIELTGLEGRKLFPEDVDLKALIAFDL